MGTYLPLTLRGDVGEAKTEKTVVTSGGEKESESGIAITAATGALRSLLGAYDSDSDST